MGQVQSSIYSNSDKIQKVLEEDTWGSFDENIIDINFASKQVSTLKYIINLDFQIPSNCNMTVIFPNHDVEKMRLLWVNSYLGHLNDMSKDINERIRQSNRENLGISVTSGDYFYRFTEFVGNIYLFWCKRVNIESSSNADNLQIENVPVIIETNGQMSIRNIFLFGENKCLNVDLCTLYVKPKYEIFCCETDARKDNFKIHKTFNDKSVDQITKDLVVKSFKTIDTTPFMDEDTNSDQLLEIESEKLDVLYTNKPDTNDSFDETF